MADKHTCLKARALIIQSIRHFFIKQGYLEVETPNIIPSPAPEIHIDAINSTHGYLHTSPELCMKRMLADGYSKIFQICKAYREGERGDRHLPEFTLLEWYHTGIDYKELMIECEEMIGFVIDETDLGSLLEYGGRAIDLVRPWRKITIAEAFKKYSSVTMEEALAQDRFDEIMISEIEPRLYEPTFLYDYPSVLASLARIAPEKPDVAERFELYIGGLELANAFTELTDAIEQKERFLADMERRRQSGKKVYPFPDMFIEDLQRMPPCAGIAFGIDRFVMLLTDRERIDDVVSFVPEEL